MSREKGKFPYSLFIVLTQWHEFTASKLTNLHVFVILFLLNVTLFSKSPYLIAHIKKKYEKDYIWRFSEKTPKMYAGPSRKLRWSSLWHQLVAFSRLLIYKEPQHRCYGSPKCAFRILWHILQLVQMIKLNIAEQ